MSPSDDTPAPGSAPVPSPVPDSPTARRKGEHLRLFAEGEGPRARAQTSWLEQVHLVHRALPERGLADLDLRVRFAGCALAAPLFITGMTGGTDEAGAINRGLARVAARLGIGFGLGSQRAMLEHPELAPTFTVKDTAPGVVLAANLGAVQAVRQGPAEVARLVERVGADLLCLHLNPAQELVQPEGERDFSGLLEGIGRLVRALPRPVVVKEVGAGLSAEVGQALYAVGVRALDVAGCGGTSWVGAEITRRGAVDDPELQALWDWGLPTAAAVAELEALQLPALELLASGGIRTGLDAARALALGATVVGLAAPALQAFWRGGEEAAERRLRDLLDGLRRVMLLTGCRTPAELRRAPRVLGEPLAGWLAQRRPPRP